MQEKLREIPEAPEAYSAATVAARMVEGLGFRFYWATEGLRPEDLSYKPSEEARTTEETIGHIYGLSRTIFLTVNGEAVVREENPPEGYEATRDATLDYLDRASKILRAGADLNDLDIEFKGSSRSSTYPFWNLINGPIADAIWHCGQVVSFRRSSGNPFNSKASLFTGKLRE